MPPSEQLVDELADAILDGTAIDWAAAESSAEGTAQPLLKQLRVLAAIGELHRSTPSSRSTFSHGAPSRSEPGVADAREHWGHLRLVERIGRGAFGDVYRAWDTRLDREVALKLLPAGPSSGDRAVSTIIHEGRLLARVRHPNVVTIYGAEQIADQIGLWMEFVRGRTLEHVVEEKVVNATEAVDMGLEICRAVSAVHGAGLLHRDIKTHNVMRAEDGRIVLMDFGTGRELDDEASSDLAGTPLYLAPEVLEGQQATVQSDIYSLGVLLYRLVAGSYPVQARTVREVRRAHERGERIAVQTARSDVPSKLARVIERAIDPRPERRYESADALGADLATLKQRPTIVRLMYAAGAAAQAETASGTAGAQRVPLSGRILRSGRGRAAVLGLLIALVAAGTLTWRSVRSGSAPVALGAGRRPAIAIMPFDNLAGGQDTAWLSKGVPSMLLTGLAQTRGLEIVSGQRLHEVIKQMGASSLETLGRSEIAEVAQRAGAGAIVVGGISKAGSEIRIDAQLEDLASGRILAAESVRGTDLFVLVDQLASRIRNGIGFGDATGIRKVSDVTTTSLEAFQLYSQGVEALFNTRMDDAQKLLERAVAIDPMFADAYLQLADASNFRGFLGLQREYLRKAAEHANRLGERQRLILEAESARAVGDSATAVRTVDELIEKFPDADHAYGLAAQLYAPLTGLVDDPEKWLTTSAAGAAALPKSMVTRNLYAYALLGAGRYEEALGEFDAYVRVAPREPNPYDSLGEAYLVMGAPDRAVESYTRALTIDPTFAGSHIGREWSLASLGRYEDAIVEGPPQSLLASWSSVRALVLSRVGRYREADQALEAGRREAEISENAGEQGNVFLVSSLLAIERGAYKRALQDCGSAERMFARLPEKKKRVGLVLVHLMSGIAHLRAGRTDQARLHLEAQGRLFNSAVEPENWWHNALEGEIALVAGDLEKAASAFSAGQPSRKMWFSTRYANLAILANNLLWRDGLARVAKARGDLPRAIQIYRELLSYGPDQKWVSVFEPRYVMEIARLLDRSGNKQAALKDYERFLDFWKRTESGLPELSEARRAVERLRPRAGRLHVLGQMSFGRLWYSQPV